MTAELSKKLDIELPDWAVSDEEVDNFMMPQGWIADYVNYASTVTDAPKAYHFATAVTMLLQALSNTDIRVYTSEAEYKKAGARCYELTTPLWTAVIGLSGDRKSFAMDLGLNILKRAVGKETVLPTDGSIEAWTDYLAKNPNVVLHREELSFLFAQSRRSYMEGLKDWLLTLHSGNRYDRTTRRKQKATDDKGMEHDTGDNEHVTIERPRVTTFGAIPPEVFRTRSESLDWSSGFFARFMFVPAIRTSYQKSPRRDIEQEGELAKRLQQIHRAATPARPIKIPPNTAQIISDWVFEEVEPLRGRINDRIYSHFTRYLELGYRLTAAWAASYWQEGDDQLFATPKHAKAARETLTALREAMEHMFSAAVKTDERSFEDELFEFFTQQRGRWFTLDALDNFFTSYSRRRLSAWCRGMFDDGRLQQKKIRANGQKTGRKRISYRMPS